jgi:hypothetical protein
MPRFSQAAPLEGGPTPHPLRQDAAMSDRSMRAAVIASALVFVAAVGLLRWSPTSHTGPSPRADVAMAFDAGMGQMLLFGGGAERSLDDTWVLHGDEWVHLHPRHSPQPRQGAAMAYDTTHHQMLLFGGVGFWPVDHTKPFFEGGAPSWPIYTDTWSWDGTDWEKLSDRLPSPVGAGMNARMVDDPANHQVVLVTVDHSTRSAGVGVFTWNGAHWTQHMVDAAPAINGGYGNGHFWPPALMSRGSPQVIANTHVQAAWDGGLRRVVCRGEVNNESPSTTWSWDGDLWEPLTSTDDTALTRASGRASGTGPAPGLVREADLFNAVASEGPGGPPVLLLHGSRVAAWSPRGWIEVTRGSTPPARNGETAAFDPSTRRTVMFGGAAGGGLMSDTWAWDGNAWAHVGGDLHSHAAPPMDTDPRHAISRRDAIALVTGPGPGKQSSPAPARARLNLRSVFSAAQSVYSQGGGGFTRDEELIWMVLTTSEAGVSGRGGNFSPGFIGDAGPSWSISEIRSDGIAEGGMSSGGAGLAPEWWDTVPDLAGE